MTLEEKAEVFATDFDYTDNSNYENDYEKDSDKIAYESYLAGAKELEQENNRLKAENEELKTRVENQKSFLERIRVKFELGEIERKEIEGYLEGEQLTKGVKL